MKSWHYAVLEQHSRGYFVKSPEMAGHFNEVQKRVREILQIESRYTLND